jgi:hypothetical protein
MQHYILWPGVGLLNIRFGYTAMSLIFRTPFAETALESSSFAIYFRLPERY